MYCKESKITGNSLVESSACLEMLPVKSKVNLADERRRTTEDGVGHVQYHLRSLLDQSVSNNKRYQ